MDEEFREIERRFEYAMKRRALRQTGAYTQTMLADAVGAAVGQTFAQSTASGWLKGVLPKDRETMIAIGLELGVDPGWLYFHPYSRAPMEAERRADEDELRKPAAQRPAIPKKRVTAKKSPAPGRKRAS